MRLGFITPIKYLEAYAIQSNLHLVLSHIAKESKEYVNFYKNRATYGDFIILDNGCYETNNPTPIEELLEIGEKINASEIILPDKICDGPGTLALIENSISKIEKGNSFKFGVVAQGKSLSEIMWMISYYINFLSPYFDTIYIPVDIPFNPKRDNVFKPYYIHSPSITDQNMFNRLAFIKAIHYSPNFSHFIKALSSLKKNIHMLGLFDGKELYEYRNYPLIRSCDSSSCFVHGMRGIKYTRRGLPCEKIMDKLDFFMQDVLSEQQHLDIIHNVRMLQGFTGEYDRKEELEK